MLSSRRGGHIEWGFIMASCWGEGVRGEKKISILTSQSRKEVSCRKLHQDSTSQSMKVAGSFIRIVHFSSLRNVREHFPEGWGGCFR